MAPDPKKSDNYRYPDKSTIPHAPPPSKQSKSSKKFFDKVATRWMLDDLNPMGQRLRDREDALKDTKSRAADKIPDVLKQEKVMKEVGEFDPDTKKGKKDLKDAQESRRERYLGKIKEDIDRKKAKGTYKEGPHAKFNPKAKLDPSQVEFKGDESSTYNKHEQLEATYKNRIAFGKEKVRQVGLEGAAERRLKAKK